MEDVVWIERTSFLGWHMCGGCAMDRENPLPGMAYVGGCGLDRENPLCLEKVPWIERTCFLGWQMFGGGEPYTNAY